GGPEGAGKARLASASVDDGDLVAAALAAVNALGEIVEDGGAVVAGSRIPADEPSGGHPPFGNTTLVVVATNARLSKERANLLARAAHDGISRAIRPSHTMWDGDTAF